LLVYEIGVKLQDYNRFDYKKLIMKNIITNAVLLFILTSCGTSKHAVQGLTFAKNPVIAHAGAFKAKQLPENSLASLKEAIRLQCTGQSLMCA
jgi:hypothetical protein